MASQEYKDKFRLWVKDTVAQNILDQIEESDDTDLDNYFDDALEEANYGVGAVVSTKWTLDTLPFAILKLGVLMQVMIGNGAWSARNSVDYSDSGGVNVRGFNKWEKYSQFMNRIERKWETSVSRLKKAQNFTDGWGSVQSEYARSC